MPKVNAVTAGKILLSVIIPCYNEEENVRPLAERIHGALCSRPFEMVFVDDGSNDKTLESLNKIKMKYPSIAIVCEHKENRGLEHAWRTALSRVRGDLVCLIDADLQNRPEDIPLLLEHLRAENLDLVQGSRIPAENADLSRLFLSRSLNSILNAAFNMSLRDNKSGFLITRKECLEEILSHKYSYHYFQCLIAVAAHAHGYRIGEVDTVFCKREHGQSFLSKFPSRVILGCLRDVAVGIIEYRWQRWC